MDGLIHMISNAASSRAYKGFQLDGNVYVSHLFFIDDMLFFPDGSRRDALLFKSYLRIFLLSLKYD